MKPKPPVSRGRWAVWMAALAVALVVFYGLFTPFWFALRALAWLAEFRARRRAQTLTVGGPDEHAVEARTS